MIKKGLENQRKNLQQLELKNEKTLRISKSKILKRTKGITLVALSGENGVLNKAKDAKIKTEIASIKEEIQIDILGKQAENRGKYIR